MADTITSIVILLFGVLLGAIGGLAFWLWQFRKVSKEVKDWVHEFKNETKTPN